MAIFSAVWEITSKRPDGLNHLLLFLPSLPLNSISRNDHFNFNQQICCFCQSKSEDPLILQSFQTITPATTALSAVPHDTAFAIERKGLGDQVHYSSTLCGREQMHMTLLL